METVEVPGQGPIFFEKLEFQPKFQGGGLDRFHSWVTGRVKYPLMAQQMQITGTVMVKFLISVDGSVTDVEVTSNTNKLLNDEVIRVVRSSPKWEPGRQGTRPVVALVTLPVAFTITAQ
jgi:protein TonB